MAGVFFRSIGVVVASTLSPLLAAHAQSPAAQVLNRCMTGQDSSHVNPLAAVQTGSTGSNKAAPSAAAGAQPSQEAMNAEIKLTLPEVAQEIIRASDEQAKIAQAFLGQLGANGDQMAAQLTHQFQAFNGVCSLLNKASTEFQKGSTRRTNAVNEYRLAARQQAKPGLNALFLKLASNPMFGVLFLSPDFRKAYNLVNPLENDGGQLPSLTEKCFSTGEIFTFYGRTAADKQVTKAKLVQYITASIRRLNEQSTSAKILLRNYTGGSSSPLGEARMVATMMDHLKTYLRFYPGAFSASFKKRETVEKAHLFCGISRAVMRDEKEREMTRNLTMAAGVLLVPASFLMPGSTLVLIGSGMLNAATTVNSFVSVLEEWKKQEIFKASSEAKMMDTAKALSSVLTSEKKAQDEMMNLFMAAGGYAVSGVKKSIGVFQLNSVMPESAFAQSYIRDATNPAKQKALEEFAKIFAGRNKKVSAELSIAMDEAHKIQTKIDVFGPATKANINVRKIEALQKVDNLIVRDLGASAKEATQARRLLTRDGVLGSGNMETIRKRWSDEQVDMVNKLWDDPRWKARAENKLSTYSDAARSQGDLGRFVRFRNPVTQKIEIGTLKKVDDFKEVNTVIIETPNGDVKMTFQGSKYAEDKKYIEFEGPPGSNQKFKEEARSFQAFNEKFDLKGNRLVDDTNRFVGTDIRSAAFGQLTPDGKPLGEYAMKLRDVAQKGTTFNKAYVFEGDRIKITLKNKNVINGTFYKQKGDRFFTDSLGKDPHTIDQVESIEITGRGPNIGRYIKEVESRGHEMVKNVEANIARILGDDVIESPWSALGTPAN